MNFSAKEFLSGGSRIYKKNFVKLLGINLLILLLLLALFALISMIIGVTMINSYNGFENDLYATPDLPASTIILIILFAVLCAIFAPVLYAGYSLIYIKLARGENTGFLDIFSGFSNFWHIWLTQYFTGILMLGGVLLFMLPIFIVFIISVGVDLINSLPWMLLLYGNSSIPFYSYSGSLYLYFLILCIVSFVAFIYWALKFMFTTFAAVDKKFKTAEAIFYGSQITNSYKWKIFLAVLLPVIIYSLVSILSGYVFGDESWPALIIRFLFGLFIYAPWLSSVLGEIYNKLSSNYDNTTTDNTEKQITTADAGIENERPSFYEEKKYDTTGSYTFSIDEKKFSFDQDDENDTVEDDGDDDII